MQLAFLNERYLIFSASPRKDYKAWPASETAIFTRYIPILFICFKGFMVWRKYFSDVKESRNSFMFWQHYFSSIKESLHSLDYQRGVSFSSFLTCQKIRYFAMFLTTYIWFQITKLVWKLWIPQHRGLTCFSYFWFPAFEASIPGNQLGFWFAFWGLLCGWISSIICTCIFISW